MSDWSDFDYDLPISRVDRGGFTRDPTTGLPIVISESTSAITGSLDFSPLSDDEREAAGLVDEGDAVLYSDAELDIGDRIDVDINTAGDKARFRVKGIETNYRFIHGGDGRTGYILEKEESA